MGSICISLATEAIKAKESKRKEALKHKDETILKLKERITQLEGKPTQELNEDDFETHDEYEAAKRKLDLKDEIRQEKLDDIQAELNAEMAEKVTIARESFEEKETAFKQQEPEYQQNVGVVQEYIDMVNQSYPDDPGFREFGQFIAFESDNAPALLNHLGKNPDKIEALLGKPPALIKRKLQAYEKEISAPGS